MKKGSIATLIFVGILLLGLSFISAVCLENQTIMKLSSATNAHGGTSSSTYTTNICYTDIFGNASTNISRVCTSTNKIIYLSSDTNAHASTTQSTAYNTPICYGNMVCISGSCPAEDYPYIIGSLSNTTNAHLSNGSNYAIKICCKRPEVPTPVIIQEPRCGDGQRNGTWEECDYAFNATHCLPTCFCAPGYVKNESGGELCLLHVIPESYWSTDGAMDLPSFSYIPGKTYSLKMVYSGGNVGENISFSIYRRGTVDEAIRNGTSAINATVGENGKAIASWQITSSDMQSYLNNIPEIKSMNLVFKVSAGGESNLLNFTFDKGDYCIGINSCSGYDREHCGSDTCSVAVDSAKARGGTCGSTSSCTINSCRCFWNSTGNGTCQSEIKVRNEDCGNDNIPPTTGVCQYSDSSGAGCDEEGLLKYSWGATWVWGQNGTTVDKKNELGWINVSNKWYYDPNGEYENCKAGSNTIPCPESVKLPFFGLFNVILALSIIAVIYTLSSKRKLLKR